MMWWKQFIVSSVVGATLAVMTAFSGCVPCAMVLSAVTGATLACAIIAYQDGE